MQSGRQTDLILLDFSKAFDKVAHGKLLLKLHFHFIRGNTLNWIKEFLDNRTQSVILKGSNLDSTPVSSGVPQDSVLGPMLFLAYINDLPDQVKSKVRLFADDKAMYLALNAQTDSEILQKDLEKLEIWENSGRWLLIPQSARAFMWPDVKTAFRLTIVFMAVYKTVYPLLNT